MIGQNRNTDNFYYLNAMSLSIKKHKKKKTKLTSHLLYICSLKELNNEYLDNSDRQLFFEIYWVSEEMPMSFLERAPLAVEGDTLYLVPSFRDYRFDPTKKEGKLIVFHKDLLTLETKEFSLSVYKLFGQSGEFSTLFIDHKNIATLRTMLFLLEDENQSNPENLLLLKAILKAFLIKLMNSAQQELISPSINEKRVYHFLLLLEDYYTSEKNVDFYATKLNLSAKRLNQILKHATGKTINQILQERTLTEAKHLLFKGNKSIREIAYTLGFQDASYFSRFFKKQTNVSPEEFRKETIRQIDFGDSSG